MNDERSIGRGTRGLAVVADFLEHEHVSYEVIEHPETFAAVDEARAAESSLARMAKTVLLHDHDGLRTAVIPASERLDLRKARVALHASGHLRLASEKEIERAFPGFDPGAVPPFSALLGTPEILDSRLLGHRQVLCSGGDHAHTLKLSPGAIKRLGKPLIADICARHEPIHWKALPQPDELKDGMSSLSTHTCRDLLSSSADRCRAGVQTVELEEVPCDDRNGT